MLSLSLSELASLVLPGDLFMKPLAARVSSLVLWRVSLREDGGGAVTCLCPPSVPTSPVHSHQHHVCCLSLCSDLCWTHRTSSCQQRKEELGPTSQQRDSRWVLGNVQKRQPGSGTALGRNKKAGVR